MDVVTSNDAVKILALNIGRFTAAGEAFVLVQLDWIGNIGVAVGITNALAKPRSARSTSNVDSMAVDRSSGTDGLGLPASTGHRGQLDRNHRLVVDRKQDIGLDSVVARAADKVRGHYGICRRGASLARQVGIRSTLRSHRQLDRTSESASAD